MAVISGDGVFSHACLGASDLNISSRFMTRRLRLWVSRISDHLAKTPFYMAKISRLSSFSVRAMVRGRPATA